MKTTLTATRAITNQKFVAVSRTKNGPLQPSLHRHQLKEVNESNTFSPGVCVFVCYCNLAKRGYIARFLRAFIEQVTDRKNKAGFTFFVCFTGNQTQWVI